MCYFYHQRRIQVIFKSNRKYGYIMRKIYIFLPCLSNSILRLKLKGLNYVYSNMRAAAMSTKLPQFQNSFPIYLSEMLLLAHSSQ